MHKYFYILFSLFLFSLFLLGSCSNEKPRERELSDRETSQQLKILKRGNGSDPESLDPQLARSESALTIVRDMYEGLLTRNAKGELVAGVAKRWVFNADDQCYRFYLRADAKWSNGDKVTASDFMRGFHFAIDINNLSPYSNLLKPINNVSEILASKLPVDALDVWSDTEHELNICMQGQSPPYALELFALPVTYPRHVSDTLLSNGAYQLKERIAGLHVILEKNSFYHQDASVYFNQVQHYTIEEANSELKRYLSNELDVTATIPPNDVNRLKATKQDEIRIATVLNTYFYGFNLSKPPFDNHALRKALSLAVDREVLVEKILGTGEKVAWTLVPPSISNYAPLISADQALDKDARMSLAESLYAQAGYSEAEPAKFELRYNSSALHKKIAIALAAMWKEQLGVEVELYNEEWKVFVQSRRQKKTQMFRSGWIADVNDASNYLELFTSVHPLNDYGYASSRFDELLELSETATSKRASMLRSAEEQLLRDYAIIPLYYYVSKHLVRTDIQGWEDNILDIHLSRYLSRAKAK